MSSLRSLLEVTPSPNTAISYRDANNELKNISYDEFVAISCSLRKELLQIVSTLNERSSNDEIKNYTLNTIKSETSINNSNTNYTNKNSNDSNGSFDVKTNCNNNNTATNSNSKNNRKPCYNRILVSCEPTPYLPILIYSIIQTPNLVLKPVSCNGGIIKKRINNTKSTSSKTNNNHNSNSNNHINSRLKQNNDKNIALTISPPCCLIMTEREYVALLTNDNQDVKDLEELNNQSDPEANIGNNEESARLENTEQANNFKRLDSLPGYIVLMLPRAFPSKDDETFGTTTLLNLKNNNVFSMTPSKSEVVANPLSIPPILSPPVYVVETSGTTGHPKEIHVPEECILPNILDLR